MSQDAKKFFSALIQDGDTAGYFRFGDLTELMTLDPSGKAMHDFVDGFVHQYGKLPSPEAMAEQGLQVLAPADPAAFFHDKMVRRYVKRALTLAAENANKFLAEEPEQALEVFVRAIDKIGSVSHGHDVADLRNVYHWLWPKLVAKWNDEVPAYKFGWPSIDKTSGGMQSGDMISLVGETGLGKTYALMQIGLHVWSTYRVPVMFFSMEMNLERVMTRLLAISTSTAMDKLKSGEFSNLPGKTSEMALLKQAMRAMEDKDAPFLMVDGNFAATVEDVYRGVVQNRPALVIIDGAYLLGNKAEMDLYKRTAINVGLIKKTVCTSLGVPVICSWQFNREGAKLKKGQQPGLEHIAHSAAIGYDSSIVLGMFPNDTVEDFVSRRINVLKGRDGERGEFLINFDFSRMDFSEVTDYASNTVFYN